MLEETAREALRMRYSLLKHFYTIIVGGAPPGGDLFRPLFFEFQDEELLTEEIMNT